MPRITITRVLAELSFSRGTEIATSKNGGSAAARSNNQIWYQMAAQLLPKSLFEDSTSPLF